ncbi:hypothetical protein Pcinc_022196 [Petrolisthes cinctipes]|uniref:Uncharacterized protein n=1 Tax=Petrolisthes cinctipes TaxID=88211 RepID=A0AAE1KIP8_PETCI|nr:hypothetical protein Pcinc_022196 [Petrolisthes cinctipes]
MPPRLSNPRVTTHHRDTQLHTTRSHSHAPPHLSRPGTCTQPYTPPTQPCFSRLIAIRPRRPRDATHASPSLPPLSPTRYTTRYPHQLSLMHATTYTPHILSPLLAYTHHGHDMLHGRC